MKATLQTLLILFVFAALAGSARAQNAALDFTLVNRTGYDVQNVYISPSEAADWGDDVMGDDVLKNGMTVEIEFHPKAKAERWDMYVTWVGYESDEDVVWSGLDLTEIAKLTLVYNAKTGETSALTE